MRESRTHAACDVAGGWKRTYGTASEALPQETGGCLRCLLLVMCTHPFAKKALTLYLARSKGREHYFGCNFNAP